MILTLFVCIAIIFAIPFSADRTGRATRLHDSVNCVSRLSTPLKNRLPVPRHIPVFMYWDTSQVPATVECCWHNWRYFLDKSHHNFVPVFVTSHNLNYFIDLSHPCVSDPHQYPALKCDFIRLMLLQRYGGVYMDASVVLTEPLDWILGDEGIGYSYFQAFVNCDNMTISCSVPVIENSFLASPPAHPLVNAWLAQLSKLTQCTSDNIHNFVASVPLQRNLDSIYHAAYHALTDVLTRTPLQQFPSVFLIKDNKFLNFKSNNIYDLCKNAHVKYNKVLKLIKSERDILDEYIQLGLVHKNSFVDTYLLRHLSDDARA